MITVRPRSHGALFQEELLSKEEALSQKGGDPMNVKTNVKAGDDNIVWGN